MQPFRRRQVIRQLAPLGAAIVNRIAHRNVARVVNAIPCLPEIAGVQSFTPAGRGGACLKGYEYVSAVVSSYCDTDCKDRVESFIDKEGHKWCKVSLPEQYQRQYCAYRRDGHHEVVIGVRASVPGVDFDDWLISSADSVESRFAATWLTPRERCIEAEEVVEQFSENHEEDVVFLTGHSLGGSIAVIAGLRNTSRRVRAELLHQPDRDPPQSM